MKRLSPQEWQVSKTRVTLINIVPVINDGNNDIR